MLRLSPAHCRPHPLLAAMAMEEEALNYLRSQKHPDPGDEKRRLKKLEERLAAHEARRASIAAVGVQDPVKVIKDGDGWLIVDGRHRAADAALAGRDFPAVEVAAEEVQQVIQISFTHLRHRSKGAKAWLAVGLNSFLVETNHGGDRKSKNQANSVGLIGKKHSDSVGMVRLTRAELAAQTGVSDELINQACELFKSRQLLVEAGNLVEVARIDASIAAGSGLGGIIAGLAGKGELPTGEDGEKTRPTPSHKGAVRSIATLKTQLNFFAGWGPAGQAATLAALGDWFRADAAAQALFVQALEAAAKPRPTLAEVIATHSPSTNATAA